MKIYPKKDFKNTFNKTIWYRSKVYECSKINDFGLYVVTCELIGNEYPILSLSEIKEKFYLEDEIRDNKINNIIK